MKVKVGILGAAHMHVHSYIKELKKQGIMITGVYDRTREQAEEIAHLYQLKVSESIEELLASDCNTVFICSENSFHKELAERAFLKKKHVIVEKPMALTTKDARQMIESAAKAEVKLMVAHPVRFSTTAQELKQIIDEQALGNLVAVNASNHGKNPGGWFIEPALSGGGALIDHTVHISDLIYYYFDLTPKSVRAFIGKTKETLKVEDTGLLQVTFTNGVIMSLDTSWNRPATYPIWGDAMVELIFEKGYLTMDGFGRKMKIYSDSLNQIEDYYYGNDMDGAMIQAFIQAIEHGLPAPVSGEAGLYTVAITEKAFLAAIQEREVNFEEEETE